jgi:GNAT superfamily N-acetyltransferase
MLSPVHLVYSDNDHVISIIALRVPQESRGQGLGRRKVQALQRLAIWRDLPLTGYALPSSRGFWEAMGFTVDSTSTFTWHPPTVL